MILGSYDEVKAIINGNLEKKYNPLQPRGDHGRWTHGGGGEASHSDFGSGTLAGSFEHINAIEDLGRRAGAGTAPGVRQNGSSTMETALHNVAQAVGRRDMRSARAHLESADWANTHEANGAYTNDLAALRSQLDNVPAAATGWQGRIVNPVSSAAEHPGTFVSTGAVPFDPTAHAMDIPVPGRKNMTYPVGPSNAENWVTGYGEARQMIASAKAEEYIRRAEHLTSGA